MVGRAIAADHTRYIVDILYINTWHWSIIQANGDIEPSPAELIEIYYEALIPTLCHRFIEITVFDEVM